MDNSDYLINNKNVKNIIKNGKMKMDRYITITGLFVFTIIILISFSSAFGVSTAYWDDNPLKLAPGESKVVTLILQNKVGSENVTLRAELTNDGDGIATLTDENLDYFVLLGTSAEVHVKIEIPEDSVIRGVHQVTISFIQVASGEGGMVRVAGGFISKLPVEIVGSEESDIYVKPVPETEKELFSANFLIILIVLIAAVIAIIVFLTIRKNKK